MKHSPVLGINIPIAVWIDGKQAGAFAKGHIYERYLTPGRHDVDASRPGRLHDSWHGTVGCAAGGNHFVCGEMHAASGDSEAGEPD